ncbi:MAG: MFS transporter, partial [Gemmatimonadetes bacterium]|nr:MFS transporter [Gemmatimonadota bacterium]
MADGAKTGGRAINAERLFFGTCFALVPTAASFAIIGDILGPLKAQFILTNYQVGLIGGAALWGMAISQILLGSLADFGMRTMLRLAFACHLIGVATMISASLTGASGTAFWVLFAGALALGIGNGFVEVAGNPLVAALYPEEKVTRLNQFHGWFPAGMVIAGLASYALGLTAFGTWEVRLGLTFVPILIYGALVLRETFPETEGVQAGVRFGDMFRVTFTSPLFLVMLFCMMITASLELGPMRWIPAVLQAGGIPGILVLVWISGLMAILRFKAGPLVERLSPTGLLLGSAIVSGTGLLLLSYAESGVMAFLVATIFAVGIAFFWPTMLGFVNERIPRTGALGLGLMGGIGMAITGLVTIPVMGDIADQHVPERLPVQSTVALLDRTAQSLPAILTSVPAERRNDVRQAITLSSKALGVYRQEGALPGNTTANALRALISSGVESPLVQEAQVLLGPAENYGGRISFRYVAPLALIIT